MDPERLKEIVSKARELPESERAAYLDKACGNDAELRREAAKLVGLGSEAEGFLEDSPMRLTGAPLSEGAILGP